MEGTCEWRGRASRGRTPGARPGRPAESHVPCARGRAGRPAESTRLASWDRARQARRPRPCCSRTRGVLVPPIPTRTMHGSMVQVKHEPCLKAGRAGPTACGDRAWLCLSSSPSKARQQPHGFAGAAARPLVQQHGPSSSSTAPRPAARPLVQQHGPSSSSTASRLLPPHPQRSSARTPGRFRPRCAPAPARLVPG